MGTGYEPKPSLLLPQAKQSLCIKDHHRVPAAIGTARREAVTAAASSIQQWKHSKQDTDSSTQLLVVAVIVILLAAPPPSACNCARISQQAEPLMVEGQNMFTLAMLEDLEHLRHLSLGRVGHRCNKDLRVRSI